MSTHSAFAEVNQRIAQAGEILNIDKGVIQAISSCEREVVISIPLHRSTGIDVLTGYRVHCLLYTSPSPRDRQKSRMPSSA